MRRVVVTGIGLVTPIGVGKDEPWSAAVNGKSGIGPLTHFDCSDFPTKIAGQRSRTSTTNLARLTRARNHADRIERKVGDETTTTNYYWPNLGGSSEALYGSGGNLSWLNNLSESIAYTGW